MRRWWLPGSTKPRVATNYIHIAAGAPSPADDASQEVTSLLLLRLH